MTKKQLTIKSNEDLTYLSLNPRKLEVGDSITIKGVKFTVMRKNKSIFSKNRGRLQIQVIAKKPLR
jgi:riboflavin synthase alpha subunit